MRNRYEGRIWWFKKLTYLIKKILGDWDNDSRTGKGRFYYTNGKLYLKIYRYNQIIIIKAIFMKVGKSLYPNIKFIHRRF